MKPCKKCGSEEIELWECGYPSPTWRRKCKKCGFKVKGEAGCNPQPKDLARIWDKGQELTEAENLRNALGMATGALDHFVVGAKAAYIAGLSDGPEEGMKWLRNLLWGPGFLPSDEEVAMGAQAFSDANSKV